MASFYNLKDAIILYNEVINLLSSFNSWSLIHVLRDKNKVADKLANEGRKKVNI